MIFIFHGDDTEKSRQLLNSSLDQLSGKTIVRFDSKEIDLEKLNLSLNSSSLFSETKVIVIYNLFSQTKSILEKTASLLNQNRLDIFIWQDKSLTVNQLKTFPKARLSQSRADNILYSCLNSIKPKNIISFCQNYDKVIAKNLYDLFLYLLKNNFRRQLQKPSSFSPDALKKVYLQLIELDYQNKSGQLSIPKETALKRIIINLVK